MAHAGLGERLGADEEVALIDGATVYRQGRADQGELLSSAASRASVTGPILPAAVLSKVEQYFW